MLLLIFQIQANLSQYSQKDVHMDTPSRLRAAIEEKYKTIQAFSRAADVPYRTIYQYLSGTRLPGADALVKICAHLGLNIHWLLTGEGEQYAVLSARPEAASLSIQGQVPEQGSVQTGPMVDEAGELAHWKHRTEAAEHRVAELERDLKRFQATVDTYRRQEISQLLSELGLTDLALLARRGTQESIWSILSVLEERPHHTLELEKLAEALQVRGEPLRFQELVADLAVLNHKGLIRETSEDGVTLIQLASPVSRMAGKEVGDVSQVAKDCVRELVRKIVPLSEERKGRGYFARIACRVPSGSGKVLVEQLPTLLIDRCRAAEVENQTEESVHIVFGIAHSGT